MPIISFEKHKTLIPLYEELSLDNILEAGKKISKYLNKKTQFEYFVYPELERFQSDEIKGFGLRLYANKGSNSVRFNFKNSSPDLYGVSSVTLWIRNQKFNINFNKESSFAQTLPVLADFINDPTSSVLYTPPEGDNPDKIEEAIIRTNMLYEMIDGQQMTIGVIDMLTQPEFSKSKVYKAYRSPGYKIINALVNRYPNLIEKQGTKYMFSGSDADIAEMKAEVEDIMDDAGVKIGRVTRGAPKETYATDDDVLELEENKERLTFEEQLSDMGNLLKLTISGASNACFIAGRGGVGKTYSAEKILDEGGLSDGDGYFLNKGSISAAGLYASLFEHKDTILVFDDADDVFKDQTSRNLLKGATDTSPVRKLNWNKMGSNVVDPDEMSDAEILDSGKIPKYFNFTGKIIFISNLKMDQLDPDGALRTRGFMISIDPTDEEVYDFMDKIVDNMKLKPGLYLSLEDRKYVVKLLREGTSKQTANLRKLKRGLNMLAGARKAGVNVADKELERMISLYA